eukprot:356797-Chlamydomonas_euryale.AAC.2
MVPARPHRCHAMRLRLRLPHPHSCRIQVRRPLATRRLRCAGVEPPGPGAMRVRRRGMHRRCGASGQLLTGRTGDAAR